MKKLFQIKKDNKQTTKIFSSKEFKIIENIWKVFKKKN